MSGLEVPGLVFGVLPVFVQVLQSYRNIYDTLHTFRHYSRTVKRIRDRFKIQQHNFQNEYFLLQDIIVGEDDLEAMRTDKYYMAKRGALMEEYLNKRVGDSYGACEDIANSTKKELDEMEEDLKSFAILKGQKRKVSTHCPHQHSLFPLTSGQQEKLKAAIHRVRDSITVAFEKEHYESRLTKLRENNMDLHLFRMQLAELLDKRLNLSRPSKTRKRLPLHYSSVQKVSQTLHEALSSALNCPNSGHETHYGKLCVEAQVQDTVRLDLALSYKISSSYENSNTRYFCPFSIKHIQLTMSFSIVDCDDHVWFYVQSTNLETSTTEIMQETSLSTENTCQDLTRPATSGRTDTISLPALQPALQSSHKRRKVQISNDCISVPSIPRSTTQASQMQTITRIQDLCQHIQKTSHFPETCGTSECIGYLETPRLFKHMLYSNERTMKSQEQRQKFSQEVISLEYLLRTAGKESALMDAGSRLKIAHRIANTVLQYHSTPWLREDWRLKDLAYFGDTKELSRNSFCTLHLTFPFNQNNQELESMRTRWGTEDTPDSAYSSMVSVNYQYGINNSVLFGLGVALLELAYNQPLEQMCGTEDLIVTARKKALSTYPLGEKYRRIVEQCMKCDFAAGSDLTREELQTAFYTDVICSLEEMMNCLSLD